MSGRSVQGEYFCPLLLDLPADALLQCGHARITFEQGELRIIDDKRRLGLAEPAARDGAIQPMHHVISLAAAEMARPLRFLLIPFGAAPLITPFVYDANTGQTIAGIASGLALIALSLRRGVIRGRYGEWQKMIV